MAKKNVPAVAEEPVKAPSNKMTLEEYQASYSQPVNAPFIKPTLFFLAAGIGLIIACLEALLVAKLFDIHEIAGYVGILVAALLFIFFYIVPLLRIHRTKAFVTNVDERNLAAAKRQNRKLRGEIADHIIDITAKTEGLGWYGLEAVGKLAIARQTQDDEALKGALVELYQGDVAKAAHSIIKDASVRIGIITALAQDEKLDSLFVAVYEFKLIKDLVTLYGYRPSDAQLLKIYGTVISNALVAYGASVSTHGIVSAVANSLAGSSGHIGALIGLLGTVIGSTAQGFINGFLTIVIGKQLQHTLKKEYRLQDILDGVEVAEIDEESTFAEAKTEVDDGLKAMRRKTPAK